MCIEKEIAANTAAINALTAAVRQLLDALPSRLTGADSRSVIVDKAPAPVAGDDHQRDLRARASAAGLSAGEVNLLAAAPAPVTPAPAPVNPAPAPVAPAPAQDGMWYPGGGEIPETPLTLADVRSVCVRAGQAGYTQAVVDFLAARGVKLLTELPPAQYPALLMMLAEKGVR